MKKLKLIITVFLLGVIFSSCNQNKSCNNELDTFTGKWDITIYKLPKVGDRLLSTTIEQKDTILTGFFIDIENKNTTQFETIEVDGNAITCKYNWDGHDVSLVLKADTANTEKMSGKFMKLFKVEALRKDS